MIQGQVLEVSEIPMGSELALDHASGATQLFLATAIDFDTAGGMVRVGSSVYQYISVDLDSSAITLASGLTSAQVEGTDVWLDPATFEKWAMIDIGEFVEPITARVPHSLYTMLDTGIRDEVEREQVEVEQDDKATWMLRDIVAKTPIIESGYLDIVPVTEQDAEEIRQALEEARQNAETGIEEAKQAAAEADAAATEAYAAAGLADLVAKSKTTNYPPSSSPPAVPNGGHKIGDTWQDSTKGNLQHTWDGTAWAPVSLGSRALDDFIITARKQFTAKHILY